jgi:hypothetical protein
MESKSMCRDMVKSSRIQQKITVLRHNDLFYTDILRIYVCVRNCVCKICGTGTHL